MIMSRIIFSILLLLGCSAVLVPAANAESPAATNETKNPLEGNDQLSEKAVEKADKPVMQATKALIPKSLIPVTAEKLPPPFPDKSEKKAESIQDEEDPVVSNFRDDQLSPESITAIRKIILDARRSTQMPVEGRFQAKAVNRVLNLDLSPGVTPPIIRIGERQGCSITFSDVNGKEWPMLNYTNFTPTVATVKRPIDNASLITIEPKDTSGMGNVTVYLKGINDEVVPVSFSVLMEQKEADYIVSAIVPRILSSDKSSSLISNNVAHNESLELALAGISPPNSVKLVSSDDRVEAWKFRRDAKSFGIILRSKAVLISPAPLSGRKMTSRDGTRAYEVDVTPLVTILASGSSQIVTLTEKEK